MHVKVIRWHKTTITTKQNWQSRVMTKPNLQSRIMTAELTEQNYDRAELTEQNWQSRITKVQNVACHLHLWVPDRSAKTPLVKEHETTRLSWAGHESQMPLASLKLNWTFGTVFSFSHLWSLPYALWLRKKMCPVSTGFCQIQIEHT